MESNNIYMAAAADCAGLQVCPPGNYRSAEDFASIPDELNARRQWINWKVGQINANGKFKKVPIDPETGIKMNADHPGNWQGFEETVAYYCAGVGDGIGYVFSENDPYAGIDLDVSRDPNGTSNGRQILKRHGNSPRPVGSTDGPVNNQLKKGFTIPAVFFRILGPAAR